MHELRPPFVFEGISINIYKAETDLFVAYFFDSEGSYGSNSSIASLAETAKRRAEEFFGDKRMRAVRINFSFPQDILHYSGMPPMRCSCLSEEEKAEFWKAYNAP